MDGWKLNIGIWLPALDRQGSVEGIQPGVILVVVREKSGLLEVERVRRRVGEGQILDLEG